MQCVDIQVPAAFSLVVVAALEPFAYVPLNVPDPYQPWVLERVIPLLLELLCLSCLNLTLHW